jgi:hypothetical protein
MAWQSPELGQRVAVFLDDAASGATLGYYGQYMGALFPVGKTAQGRPEFVRVFVPFLKRALDVDILNVFFCPPENESTVAANPVVPLGTVRFAAPPLGDNDEIKGFFRTCDKDPWSCFHFIKTSRDQIGYEYSAPVKEVGLSEGLLFFEVPRNLLLDRTFVLQWLEKIMGRACEWKVTVEEP